MALADPPRDQLRVLRAEVEHQDRARSARVHASSAPHPHALGRCSALPSVLMAGATTISAFWNSLTFA